MATNVKIGLLVPGSFAGQPPKMDEFTRFFRRAEDLGFDSLWVIDRIFHETSIMDPLTLLTSAAAVTSRIRLGTSVLLFALRNPILVAKTTATLDYLSGGRLTLGISLGGRDHEFEPLGVPMNRRVGRFREGLEVMRKLWSEPDVTFHGRHYDMEGVNVDPKPAQKPSIPIILGGSAEAVLKRSAEEADGWVSGGRGGPEDFAIAWQKVLGYARESGKDPGGLQSGKLMYISVGPDRAECKRQLEQFTHAYYGPQYDVEENCVFGPPDDFAAKIQSFADVGAQTIMLGPAGLRLEQLDLIAGEVIPRLN